MARTTCDGKAPPTIQPLQRPPPRESLHPVNTTRPILLEVCVQSSADCAAAQRAGADRVELCQALDVGGLTPSQGAIAASLESTDLPLIVLVRPRPGDFVYTQSEIDTVARDLEFLATTQAQGAAIGALTPTGDLDRQALQTWTQAAAHLDLVFHRAFDSTAAPLETLDALAAQGFRRILTSGGASTAAEGCQELAAYIRAAGERIEILPAGTIRPNNLSEILQRTRATQAHFRAPQSPSAAGPTSHEITSTELVRAMRAASVVIEAEGKQD